MGEVRDDLENCWFGLYKVLFIILKCIIFIVFFFVISERKLVLGSSLQRWQLVVVFIFFQVVGGWDYGGSGY